MRLGLDSENAGWPRSARTRSSVSGAGVDRLERQPFVEHQRVVAIALVEGRERRHPLRDRCAGQDRQCREPVGHVVGAGKALDDARDRARVAAAHHEVERGVGKRTPAGSARAGRVRSADGEAVGDVGELPADPAGDLEAQPIACGEDRIGIDVAADLAGDVGLAGKRQNLGAEGRLERLVLGDVAQRIDEGGVELDCPALGDRRRSPQSGCAWRASAPPASD